MIRDIIDYFEKRGLFDGGKEYAGMLASQASEMFMDYFSSLGEGDRHNIADLLMEGALGNHSQLLNHAQSSCALVLDLCLADYHKYFEGWTGRIMEELLNEDNLREWTSIEEEIHIPDVAGAMYKKDWHYPLVLWGILHQINKKDSVGIHDYLTSHVKLIQFKEALINARNVYDSQEF